MAATETITSIILIKLIRVSLCFFFNDPATTKIYTLPLHDALPISINNPPQSAILGVHATKDRAVVENGQIVARPMNYLALDRKSTRLNSSHDQISYAVFCLKKKKAQSQEEAEQSKCF